VTKSRAYTTEFGFEKITAWAVMQERQRYGGRSLNKTYWSTHQPGNRKRLKHVNKGGTAFFSYLNSADEVNGDGGGESLTHQLFKEAIAGLSRTKLKLGSFGEYEITITQGETEKEIRVIDGLYYADAYWRFNSISDLELKWSGEAYIEVNHTHPIPPYKQEDLRRARLPVIEVDVPQILVYPIADENTTDPLESAHITRIQGMLENGFLAGRVISDRSSVGFMEQECARLERDLYQSETSRSEIKRRADAALQQVKTASENEIRLKNKIGELMEQVKKDATVFNDLVGKLATEKNKAIKLSKSLGCANETIDAQQKEIRIFTWSFWGVLVLVISILAFLLYRWLISPNVEVAVPVVSSPTVERTVPVPASGKAKKIPKSSLPNQ
jgi:hypothetical protein